MRRMRHASVHTIDPRDLLFAADSPELIDSIDGSKDYLSGGLLSAQCHLVGKLISGVFIESRYIFLRFSSSLTLHFESRVLSGR